MAKRKIEEIVGELAGPITESMSFELEDVEFVKEGASWYLRVYIDKQGGVTLDGCKAVSEELSEKLDKLDPIEQSYYLEVSSPGLEKVLKKDRDFRKYAGEAVEVKLFKPMDGKKIFEGELVGLVDGMICIKQGADGLLRFDRESVASVKRVLKF